MYLLTDLILVKKADYKEMEKINISLSKKLDHDNLNNSIVQVKNDLKENIDRLKQETITTKKYFEDRILEKIVQIEKSIDKSHESIANLKDITEDLYQKRDIDQHEYVKKIIIFRLRQQNK